MSSYIEWDVTYLLTYLHTFQLPGANRTTYGRHKKQYNKILEKVSELFLNSIKVKSVKWTWPHMGIVAIMWVKCLPTQ